MSARTPGNPVDRATRVFHAVVFSLTMLSIAAFSLADKDAMLFMLTSVLACVGWAFTRQPNPVPIPRWAIHAITGIAVLYALSELVLNGVTVDALSQFVVSLIVVKTFDRRTDRDHALLISLSMFAVLGAAVTSNELLPSLLIVAYVPVLLIGVLLLQMRAPQGLPQPAPERHAKSIARLFLSGGVAVLVMSAIIFVVTPRGIGSAAMSNWGRPAAGAVTGFTESIQLGRAGLISSVESVVMDVRISDKFGENLGSERNVLYLRGSTMDTYTGGGWSSTPQPADMLQTTELAPGVRRMIGQGDSGALMSLEVSVRSAPGGSMPLFSPWAAVAVILPQGGVVRTDRTTRITHRDGGGGRLQYTVECSPMPAALQVERPDEPIAFPVGVVASTARRVLLDAGIEPEPGVRDPRRDRDAVRALEQYLQSEFTYTLDILDPGGLDPIEWFLTTARTGHCEYFASALAAMCQSVGVPARVVSGYVAAEYNPGTESYVVRQSNAHAWVEASIGRGVWRTFDPTPPSDLARVHRPEITLARRVRQFFESIEHLWVTTIVSYDAKTRSELLGTRGGAASNGRDGMSRGSRETQIRALVQSMRQGTAVLVACIGVFVSWVLFERWMRSRSRRPRRGSRDQTLRALLDTLARVGDPKPDGTPLLVHARASERLAPELKPEFEALCAAYYGSRFGTDPGPDLLRRARDLRSRARATQTR